MNTSEYEMFTSKCTLLVSTCDKYEFLWQPFFKILSVEWPDMPFDVVLNTENKKFVCEEYSVRTFEKKEREKMAWGQRLKQTLLNIDTEYVLFFLDDFYLRASVDTKKVVECIKWMEEDSEISVFSFANVKDKRNKKSHQYLGFEERPLIGKYKFNCQVALWRRKDLIQYLRDAENPWEWECYGNWRSYRLWNKKFLCLSGEEEEIIPYQFKINNLGLGGLLVVRGYVYSELKNYFETKYSIKLKITPDKVADINEVKRLLGMENGEVGRKKVIHLLRPLYLLIVHFCIFVKNIRYLF